MIIKNNKELNEILKNVMQLSQEQKEYLNKWLDDRLKNKKSVSR